MLCLVGGGQSVPAPSVSLTNILTILERFLKHYSGACIYSTPRASARSVARVVACLPSNNESRFFRPAMFGILAGEENIVQDSEIERTRIA